MKRILLIASFCCLYHTCSIGQILGEVVTTWDFAAGIPAGWEQGVISENNIAHWEYRGPATEPDVATGARGSCALLAEPIGSTTASNGFIIFDSNYWDNDQNPCGLQYLGTGQDPGPHTAWIITNPIDLSQTIGAVLTFQQQYRHYLSTTRVQISTDDGDTWTDVLTNVLSESLTNVEWASVNVSSYTTGQTNVRFKFIFEGQYYWWLLDDITVYVPNENDIIITSAKYATNGGLLSAEPYHDLHYDQYPLVMIPQFNIKSTATNIGAFQQNQVSLNAKIMKEQTTQVYNQNSTAIPMNSGQSSTFSLAPYTPPAQLGEYEIFYTMNQQQDDDNETNNVDSLDYTLHNYYYARDEGPMESGFSPQPEYEQYHFEAGNFFEARNWGRICHNIGVAFAEGTQPGTQVKGVIYKYDVDNEAILAETGVYTVNYADINELGEEKIVSIPLLEDLFMMTDSIYLVMIKQIDADQPLSIVRSGDAPEEMSLLRYPEINATFYFLKTPVVRMHVFSDDDVPGCTDPSAMNYEPTATIHDGTCLYPGCANEDADNFDPTANFDDGTCQLGGCIDPIADNFDPLATYDNGSCLYIGCTDPLASNYESTAEIDDGSCLFEYAVLDISANSGCSPFTFTVYNQTDLSPAGSCLYSVDDIPISNMCAVEFELEISTPGLHTLEYAYMLNGDTTYATEQINVLPSANISDIYYDNVTYEVVCNSCTADQLIWQIDGGEVAGASGSTISTFMNGTYQNGFYQILGENANGCNAESNEVFVLQPYFTLNATEGCTPWEVQFSDLTDAVDGMVSTLNFGDGSAPIGNPAINELHTYTEAGSYTISLQCASLNGNGNFSIPVVVEESVLPMLVADGNGNYTCTNAGEFTNISWNVDGQIFTGAGPVAVNGNAVSVTGTTGPGCSGVTTIDHIAEIFQSSLRIYPVPASNWLMIENKSSEAVELTILELTGKEVWNGKAQDRKITEVDVASLATGIYWLRITSASGKSIRKIEVIH
ncbi:MAG: T9SS type A sorting domain-containing protein [Flavobacteriales bacterium]